VAIAIVDYGMGNVRSLMNAFEFVGEEAVVTRDLDELEEADRLVLPGVGAFGDAMAAIRANGLQEPLTRLALEVRKPILGVCLGMQLFAKTSHEHGEHEGSAGSTRRWCRSRSTRPRRCRMSAGTPSTSIPTTGCSRTFQRAQRDFYFVHSFHMLCHDPADLVATTDHGGTVTAVVRRGNLVAAQFHPEKSQDNGLQMLQNWMAHDFSC
jgi:glutamine amidotransferase